MESLARSVSTIQDQSAFPHSSWLTAWREVATLTAGLTAEDPRLPLILEAMEEGARAEEAGEEPGFVRATTRLHFLMQCVPGASVRWQGREGHQLMVLGPASIKCVHVADGRLWVWTAWRGQGRWVCESIITHIEPGAPHVEQGD
jgi:hypothetical protein